MRNEKRLLLKQLDEKIRHFKGIEKVSIPEKGWINTIRKALNISLEQLGKKLSLSRQGIKKIEEREVSGSITLNTLREIANKMEMQFVYGFVSKKGTATKIIDDRAQQLAQKIVLRTHHTMQLENQGNSKEQIQKAINELAFELKQEMNKSLWD